MKTIFLKKTLLLFVAIILTTYADIQAQTFTEVGNIKPGQRLRLQGVMNSESSWQRGLMSQNIYFKTTGNGTGEWAVEGSTYNDFSMMKFNNGGHIGFYTRPRNTSGNYELTHAGLEAYNRMTILNNGNVGIGTPAPLSKLHINTVRGGDLPDHEGLRVISSNGNTHIPYKSDNWANGWSFLSGKGLVFRTDGNNERMRITQDGNVGIGTGNPGTFKLAVNGTIRAKEIVVEEGWSDYVFYDDYQLPTLEEEEIHIEENGHLLGFESEENMAGEIQLGDVSKRQQAKIEEMMLHLIEIKKEVVKSNNEIAELKEEIVELKNENGQLKAQTIKK